MSTLVLFFLLVSLTVSSELRNLTSTEEWDIDHVYEGGECAGEVRLRTWLKPKNCVMIEKVKYWKMNHYICGRCDGPYEIRDTAPYFLCKNRPLCSDIPYMGVTTRVSPRQLKCIYDSIQGVSIKRLNVDKMMNEHCQVWHDYDY